MRTINSSPLTVNRKLKKPQQVNCQQLTVNCYQRGFTLVVMLVVTVIIMLLFGALITILNPKKQRDAVYDAQRVRNLEEIRGALDSYYNDFNLYPTPGAFPFNAQWQINNVVYMAKVPQD